MRKIKFLDYVKAYFNPKKYGGETIVTAIKEEIYFRELAFQTAINYIAAAISKCEFKTFEINKEVKKEEYFTLNFSPNTNENSSQFWHKVIEKMFYENTALVVPINGGLYCADSFTVEHSSSYSYKYSGITIETEQLNKTYRADEVFVFKLDNTDIKKLIDGLYSSYGKLLAYAMKSYKKSNATKYKLHISDIKSGDEEFNKEYKEIVQTQLKTFLENDEAIYPEFDGYNLEDISPKSNVKDSSDIRNLRKDIFETVAQACKIPLSLMLGNITNIKDVINAFITFAIDPLAEMISEELTRKQGYVSWQKGNYIKVDTSVINHIDILDVAEKVDKLIASGSMCVDEIRDKLGIERLNTEFSQTHFITKNYDTAENRLKGGEGNE